MKYANKYIESSKCLIRVWSGAVTAKDIQDAQLAMLQYVNQDKQISGILSDLSNTTEYNISYDDARIIAETSKMVSHSLPDIFFAVVAPRALIFGMTKVWEALCHDTGWTIEVFNSYDEADSWLSKQLGIDLING